MGGRINKAQNEIVISATMSRSIFLSVPRAQKGIEAQRVKPPTPSRATDALIGKKQQNGKQKNRKKNREQDPQASYPEPFSSLLRPAWIIRWTYSKPPHRGK